MMPALSYIIPVFNGGKCVSYCLDSIYSLPLHEEEFEVVVIDDCSTDDTLQVLRDYASKHSNMFVLHQEVNQRQGAARNRGIDVAKGEYIAFCDADDTIVAGGVMNALKAVSETKVDICYFDFEYEQSRGVWQRFQMPFETHNTVLSGRDYLENYYTCYYNAPWRCLYRADFLRETDIRFEECVRWEDCDWTVKVYAKAKQIQFVDGVGYRYAYGAGSVSHHRMSGGAIADNIYAGLRLMEYGDEIREELSGLSKVVTDEGRYGYVHNMIRLRNLTKYPLKEIKALYDVLGVKRRQQLLRFDWPLWDALFLKHRIITMIILFVGRPLTLLGRGGMKIIRKSRRRLEK